MDGVEVSVMGCFINSCQCQPIHPFLMVEEQSSVYQSQNSHFFAKSFSLPSFFDVHYNLRASASCLAACFPLTLFGRVGAYCAITFGLWLLKECSWEG